MIRVLIVDDSVFMRTVLTDIMGGDDSIEIVGSAEDGVIALQKIDELSTISDQPGKNRGQELGDKGL